MIRLIVQGQKSTVNIAQEIAVKLNGTLVINENYAIIDVTMIEPSDLQALRSYYECDINAIPTTFEVRKTKLLVLDMDSTLINVECIDELADCINAKAQVAKITEAAMRGEMDFETSLRSRVAFLKGVEVNALEYVYQERLKLNLGAEVMLGQLQKQGIKTALVSGGFTFFTERLKKRLGLDFSMANTLGEHKGRLTGEIEGNIYGAQEKADFLLAHCDKLAILPQQVVAMGDGANDLPMMKEAGLSVAYHARPRVQEKASTILNYSGLDGLLGLLQL